MEDLLITYDENGLCSFNNYLQGSVLPVDESLCLELTVPGACCEGTKIIAELSDPQNNILIEMAVDDELHIKALFSKQEELDTFCRNFSDLYRKYFPCSCPAHYNNLDEAKAKGGGEWLFHKADADDQWDFSIHGHYKRKVLNPFTGEIYSKNNKKEVIDRLSSNELRSIQHTLETHKDFKKRFRKLERRYFKRKNKEKTPVESGS